MSVKLKDVVKNKKMMIYLLKFIIRLSIFIIFLVMYIFKRDELYQLATQSVTNGITSLHILWVIFMCIMLSHLFPINKMTMALRKGHRETYSEVTGYSEIELHRFIQKQNIRAWVVMLVWLIFNGIWGGLYLAGILENIDLLMLTVFYFLCDYICILFYCPFQHLIMKNKCCVNCRIYDWGHFMMFTPMMFIKDFFSWSLFFVSCVVLIHWEIIYAKHPERFWYGSNNVLKCSQCKDKTCMVKHKPKKG